MKIITIDYPFKAVIELKSIPKTMKAKTTKLQSILTDIQNLGVYIDGMQIHEPMDFVVEMAEITKNGEYWHIGS